MHIRTLSARNTVFAKFIVAPVFGLMCLILLAIIWHWRVSLKGDGLPLPFVVIFLLLWFGFAALTVSRMIRWKRVRIDTGAFHISNYLREIQVPLGQLSSVREQRGFGPRTIVLTFNPATAFGEAVRFAPRMHPLFWRPHPVVAELQAIIAGAPLTDVTLHQAIVRDRKRLLIGVALLVAFFGGIYCITQRVFTHSEPYRLGLEALIDNAAVVEALGAPVQPGWVYSGEMRTSPGNGCASFEFGLHGSRASGDAGIDAVKAEGRWRLFHVWLERKGGGRIEVVNDPSAGEDCIPHEPG